MAIAPTADPADATLPAACPAFEAGIEREPLTAAYGAAFHAHPAPQLLAGPDGRILAANAAAGALLGRSPEAAVGLPIEVLLPDWAATTSASAPSPAQRLRRANGDFAMVELAVVGLGRDGGGIRLVVLTAAPLARPVSQAAPERADAWAFQQLFDAAPYGLMIVDDDGRIAQVNPQLGNWLGHAPAGLVGEPLERLLPERYRGRHGALMAGYQRSGEARAMGAGRDLTALHANGREVPVEIGLSRVPWRGRTMTLAAVVDLRLRKQLERGLRQANANLQEFSYVASHDLRSPLRGIADLVEWIREDLQDPPVAVARNLERVGQRIVRLEQLIDDLLRYARAGRATRELTQVDVGELVRAILDIQPMPPSMRLTLQLQAGPFLAARTPLETVLRNLLSNAVKHHDRPRGEITLCSAEDDHWCEILVTDDGPGIPPGARERIFKLFQTATANERGGSGLGLALTKRLVEVHGGTVDVSSPVRDGRGAAFRVCWPRFPQQVPDDD